LIATLLLVLLLGGAGAYYVISQPGLDTIGSTVIAQILEPITLAVTKTFTILGYLAVPLMVVVPVYLLWSNRQRGDDTTQVMIWGLVYGGAIYGIAYATGLDNLLSQAMRSSMAATPMMGSTLGLAVSSIGAAATWLINLLQGIALWGAGIVLAIVGAALDAMAGLGSAAEKASKPVKKAQKGILERLLGGSS